MNTATEVKVESDSERSSIDRRRRMTLVGPAPMNEKRRPFNITVSGEIFSGSREGGNSLSGGPPAAEKRAVAGHDVSSGRLVTLGAGVAIVGAIVLGYLIGRKRD